MSIISADPEVVSGTPVFTGTRVPVETLLHHLEDCDGMDTFLEDFSSVSREDAVTCLRAAFEALMNAETPGAPRLHTEGSRSAYFDAMSRARSTSGVR